MEYSTRVIFPATSYVVLDDYFNKALVNIRQKSNSNLNAAICSLNALLRIIK